MEISVIDERIDRHRDQFRKLLAMSNFSYADAKPSSFPEYAGIYAIEAIDGLLLRAGKTRNLKTRLYHDHLMSSAPGNLPKQLVDSGTCVDLVTAKAWIYKNCKVRWLEVTDERERTFFEHFMLAVVQPKFCDKNQQN